MRRLIAIAFTVSAVSTNLTTLTALAQTKTISECENALIKKGFVVTQKDKIKDKLFTGVYEYEATKNEEKWKIKTDENCKVLYERRKS